MNTLEAIEKRRTVRKFTQEKLSDDMLLQCVQAARLAPTGANLQPMKFKIINDKKTVAEIFKYVKWAGYIAPEGNPKPWEEPTVFIAVMADLDIKKAGFEVDAGSCVATMLLAAEELGIGTCWMQAIHYEKISEILALPEKLKLFCVVAMGIKAEQPVYIEKTGEDIRYFKDENGVLNVPKRTMEEVLI